MEKLLRDIDEDVASITLSRSLSSSSTNGFWAAGAVPGMAAKAIGNLALRSVERVTVSARLRKIGEQLKQEEVFLPPDVYEDLLEIQR